MTDQQEPISEQQTASWVPAPPVADGSQGPTTSSTADRPELAVGAAFAGGFLAALILKRIAG